jgi:hypothetical protein
MDGLQRLSAIRDFYADEFALEGLQEWSELNGKRYSQLPAEVRKGVDRRYLSSIILLHETAKSEEEAQRLKQLVFERINSGGERLTPQESRNAIFPGPMNSLCIELSRDENLRALWHIPDVSGDIDDDLGKPEFELQLGKSLFKTMGDVELVLRFFAYRQQLKSQESLTLRDYLDAYLRRGNALPESELEGLAQTFKSAAAIVFEVFGEYALYMYKEYKGKWRYTGRPTLTVYDPLMWAVSANLHRSTDLAERAHSARELLKEMYKQHPQSFSGRTAERPDIERRNELFRELIDTVLQGPPDAAGVDSSSEPEVEEDAFAMIEEGAERSEYPEVETKS